MPTLVVGRIITIDSQLPDATWMVLNGERVQAIGNGFSPVAHFDEVLDFGSSVIVPGFNDAHNHLMAYGFKLQEVDLHDVISISQIKDTITQEARCRAIVRGYGYNQTLLKEGRHPLLDELDDMVPDRPLIIVHTSGHMLVANSAALRLAGINRFTPNPPGGVIVRDVHGKLTGLIQENAQSLIIEALPKPTLEEMVAAIARASARYATWGITSSQEAGVGWHGTSELSAWQVALESGRLLTRVLLMPDVRTINWEKDMPFLYQGMRTGFGDIHLRLGPVKIFADGSLIGRTAALVEPYEGSSDRGMLLLDPEQLQDMVDQLNRHDWRVAVHAIGDLAVSTTLDAFDFANGRKSIASMRHRIEHAGVLPDYLLDRCQQLSVLPIPQQHFIGALGETFRTHIGTRVKHSYRQKSILDKGLVLAGSSDCFVVDGRPLFGIHDAVNQLTATGRPYAEKEALTPLQALTAYTYGSAYAAKEEHDKGRLKPGMLADFVVLDSDPRGIDPMGIRDIQVLATYCGGQNTYRA